MEKCGAQNTKGVPGERLSKFRLDVFAPRKKCEMKDAPPSVLGADGVKVRQSCEKQEEECVEERGWPRRSAAVRYRDVMWTRSYAPPESLNSTWC